MMRPELPRAPLKGHYPPGERLSYNKGKGWWQTALSPANCPETSGRELLLPGAHSRILYAQVSRVPLSGVHSTPDSVCARLPLRVLPSEFTLNKHLIMEMATMLAPQGKSDVAVIRMCRQPECLMHFCPGREG